MSGKAHNRLMIAVGLILAVLAVIGNQWLLDRTIKKTVAEEVRRLKESK